MNYDSWRNVCVYSRVPNISKRNMFMDYFFLVFAACCRKFFSILMIYSLFRGKDGVWGGRLMSLRSDFFSIFVAFVEYFVSIFAMHDDLWNVPETIYLRFTFRILVIGGEGHLIFMFCMNLGLANLHWLNYFILQCDYAWTGLR